MDFLDIVWGWIVTVAQSTWRAIVYLYQLIISGLQYTWAGLVQVARGVLALGGHLLRGLRALAHLNFRSIWNAIKKGWDRFRRALDWYQRTILEPVDKLRRDILDIYRRYFRPLILTIDQFRSIVRVVAIFDRRLAAKLDSRLYALERKIMWPITETLRRINAHTSYLSALITASGYLDRILVLETLRRDALLVWEVLTNPLGTRLNRTPPLPGTPFRETVEEARLYLRTGTGPLAAEIDALVAEGRDFIREV